MSRNIETTPEKRLFILVTPGIAILCLFLFGNFILRSNIQKEQRANIVATQTVLTTLHGREVEEAIKEYWLQLGSVETLKNPDLIYEIASGQLADDLYSASEYLEYGKGPFNIFTKSVEITNVRVMGYSDSRFKAIACGKLETEDVGPDGTILNSNVFAHGWFFVFIRQNEKWKALGYLSTVFPNAYEESPQWLQQVIGEMPDYRDARHCGAPG